MITEKMRFYLFLCTMPFFAALSVFLFNIAWPLLLCLVTLSGIAFLLHKIATASPVILDTSSFQERILIASSKALLPNILIIIFGLCIVCSLLVLLNLAWFMDDSMVQTYEMRLSELRAYLEELQPSHATLAAFLAVISACLFITTIWPSTKLMGKLASIKTASSRALLLLTTLASFTFFGTYSLAKYEHYLVSVRMEEFRDEFQSINQAQREIVAAAIVFDSIQTQPSLVLLDLPTFLRDMSSNIQNDEVVRRFAKRASLRLTESPMVRKDIDAVRDVHYAYSSEPISRVERWLKYPDQADPPTLRDLQTIKEKADKMSLESSEATKAVSLAMEEGISRSLETSDLLPSNPILKSLAGDLTGDLIGELVEHLRSHVKGSRVFTFDSAMKMFKAVAAFPQSISEFQATLSKLGYARGGIHEPMTYRSQKLPTKEQLRSGQQQTIHSQKIRRFKWAWGFHR